MSKPLLATSIALLALTASILPAHAAKAVKADFSLTISIDSESIKSQKDMRVMVKVIEKNISVHKVEYGRDTNPRFWYKMNVRLDGEEVPMIDLPKRIPPLPEPDSCDCIVFSGDYWMGHLKVGEAMPYEVPLSDYFDFTAPGQYQVTFSRQTQRFKRHRPNPPQAEVKSNTLTFTVLPSESIPQPIPPGYFVLHIRPTQDAYIQGESVQVLADETNVSAKPINCSIVSPESNQFNAAVVKDGLRLETKLHAHDLACAAHPNDVSCIRTYSDISDSCEPGQTQHYRIQISDFYDMTEPGKYQITFSDWADPTKVKTDVPIKSNTITITVLPSESIPQPTPPGYFVLHIRSDKEFFISGEAILIRADKTNVSKMKIFCMLQDPRWQFEVEIKKDGVLLERKYDAQEAFCRAHPDDGACIPDDSPISGECPPGLTAHYRIRISEFYDLTTPGKYEVTFSDLTHPSEGKQRLTVKSNTLTFTVLPKPQ